MKDDSRPDPDALLAGIRKQTGPGGKLKLFLGMCPGVGKTYAMLQAARQKIDEGIDVLAGVVETHGRAETAALLDKLPVLPRKPIEHGDHRLEEFDIDGVLLLKPQIVLVDELAHTNAPGSRHLKRFQDVLEILDAGIDVYTTLNIQHIESQVDVVRQITGVTVQETVPDSILDRANEIQLIDLSTDKLLERLAEGRVYLGDRAVAAAANFFKESNLTALRELALRFTAEQVDRDLEDIRRARKVASPWKTNARLLVGVGPSPYAESLIRWTRRAAGRLQCPWIVAWVEPSAPLSGSDQERLTRSLALARRLGAEIVNVSGDDIAQALLDVARERNVSQIVVGKPERWPRWRQSLAETLISQSGDIDVCVIRPLATAAGERKAAAANSSQDATLAGEYGWVIGIVLLLTAAGAGIETFAGYMLIAFVFLAAVVGAALKFTRGPVLLLAALLALSWNFFFIPPKYTFFIAKPEDVSMFAMFFVVAAGMGSLTSRLRARELAEQRRQRQTAALLRFTEHAALSAEPGTGLRGALAIIEELFDAETALIERGPDHSLRAAPHEAGTATPSEKEWGVISWSFKNRQVAGRDTDTLPQSEATWFPVQTASSIMGVLGVWIPEDAKMDFRMRQTLEAFVLQLAVVLEKEHIIQAVTRAEMLEQSERLRRTLLDSVSHELKTPLAVIHAALEGLGDTPDPYMKEIATASQRLQRVVTNLLQMTQIESSVVQPNRDWSDAGDIIRSACEGAGEALQTHRLVVRVPEHLPPVQTDPVLLAQVLANVLHNASVYTAAQSSIEITASQKGEALEILVRDWGGGLPKGEENRVFEKFYRAPGTPAGGTGLGLPIAQGLVRAMGGSIAARNHAGGGAEFEIRIEHAFARDASPV